MGRSYTSTSAVLFTLMIIGGVSILSGLAGALDGMMSSTGTNNEELARRIQELKKTAPTTTGGTRRNKHSRSNSRNKTRRA